MLRLRHFLYVLALVMLAFCRARAADIYDCYNGSSEQGGNRITVNGIQSNQYVQQSYPGAVVTVYVHNTLTLASIFQDAAGTLPLANPFSSSAHSVAFVCAADGRYDFKYSGSTITTPFTVSDIKYCFACQGGGGGGGVNPGTPKQVTRYNTAGTNVEDSSGSDDPLNGPTRWTDGLSVVSNGLAKQAVNSPNGTTVNLLACADASVTLTFQVTTCAAGTTKAYGVVDNGAGTSGNVQIYDHAYHACVFDNQTAVNDYAAPSATNAGQCSDVGGAKPNNVEVLGKIVSLNSGAGTLATVDWFTGDTIAPGSGGGSGTVSTCASANSNALFAVSGTVVTCDALATDDSAGNMTMRSLGLTDATQAGFMYQLQGTLPALSVLHSVYLSTQASIGTTYGIQWFGSAPTAGHCIDLAAGDSAGWLKLHDAGAACGTGSGATFQTNSVNNTSQVLLNHTNDVGVMGTTTVFSNPSGGVEKLTVTPAQISTPSAPTLSTNGSAGSTSITYKIVGCEDTACAYHTPVSAGATIATANATLSSSNSVNLSAYLVYGPRCYNVYRTAAGGTPSTTGLIAACVGTKFIDTGLAGDSTTALTTNTTELFSDPVPLPGCANPQGSPHGIDAPPCSPNADSDEFTDTFQMAGINDGFWTLPITLDANSTMSLTSGMVAMVSTAGTGSNHLQCIMHPVPVSTPWTFKELQWETASHANTSAWAGMALYESGTGKFATLLCSLDPANNPQNLLYLHWSTASAKANVFIGATDSCQAVSTFKVQDDGTNLIWSQSTDGVSFSQEISETIGSAFTTAPSHVGMCFTNAGAGGSLELDVDYFRRTQ